VKMITPNARFMISTPTEGQLASERVKRFPY
jgi:hypothetical protein